MRKEQEINEAIERYADTVRRLCMLHLKNHADTEDIFQTVFLKYALNTEPFADAEHKKAWLIRVTINACKDLLKSFFRSRTVSLDEVLEQPVALSPDHREVLEAVLAAAEVAGCDLPALLRGLFCARNQPHPGEKRQHGLHAAGPRQAAAARSTGR